MIRPENPGDRSAVVSLVAELEGEVIGHIAPSGVIFDETPVSPGVS